VIDGDALREHHERGFRGAVRHRVGRGAEPCDGGDRNERALPVEQRPDGRSRGHEGTHHVHAVHVGEAVGIHLEQRPGRPAPAGVEHEPVEPTEALDRRGDGGLGVGTLADVARERERADLVRQSFERLGAPSRARGR
jgi:hypothetical protein